MNRKDTEKTRIPPTLPLTAADRISHSIYLADEQITLRTLEECADRFWRTFRDAPPED